MSDVFKERFRELPIFNEYCEALNAGIQAGISIEELASRMMILAENGLNWDTLCQNCGVLMDKNYAQYVEIDRLREKVISLEEDLAYAENQILDLDEALTAYEHLEEENRF